MSLEQNKEIALGLSKAIMNGDWDKVDQLLADDFTYVGDGAPAINKTQYTGFMRGVLCAGMTEMDMKFLRVIAEGDLVAIEYTNEMTHSGEIFGVPATGKRVMGTGQFIREVKNGKVTAEWQTTNAPWFNAATWCYTGKEIRYKKFQRTVKNPIHFLQTSMSWRAQRSMKTSVRVGSCLTFIQNSKNFYKGKIMKNLRLLIAILFIGLAIGFTACDKSKKNSENLEKNKKIAIGLSKAIMNAQWDKVDQLISDDFIYIADGRPAINKQQYIGFMRGVLSTAMTDMDMKFLRVIAEGDLVAIDYTNQMTNSGAFMGIPATNKRLLATGQFIREVKNGKVTAEWQTTNALGLMQQLGVIPKKK